MLIWSRQTGKHRCKAIYDTIKLSRRFMKIFKWYTLQIHNSFIIVYITNCKITIYNKHSINNWHHNETSSETNYNNHNIITGKHFKSIIIFMARTAKICNNCYNKINNQFWTSLTVTITSSLVTCISIQLGISWLIVIASVVV